jgi:hypothetical protein
MDIKIQELTFILPPTLNEQIDAARGSKWQSASLKKKWTKYVMNECSKQNSIAFEGRVWVYFTFSVKTFAFDPCENLPASLKYVLDGMVLAGVLKNDNLGIIQDTVQFWYEKTKSQNMVKATISNHPGILFDRMIAYREKLLKDYQSFS